MAPGHIVAVVGNTDILEKGSKLKLAIAVDVHAPLDATSVAEAGDPVLIRGGMPGCGQKLIATLYFNNHAVKIPG